MVDYDSQRHSFQALQTNMKKRDDAKIAKGREQLEEAKRTYEMLNSELHDELPALFDSRILFYVTNLQSLFNAEHVFHSEAAKVSWQYCLNSIYLNISVFSPAFGTIESHGDIIINVYLFIIILF